MALLLPQIILEKIGNHKYKSITRFHDDRIIMVGDYVRHSNRLYFIERKVHREKSIVFYVIDVTEESE